MKAHLSLALLSLLLLTVSTSAQDKVKRVQLEGLDVAMTLKKRTPTPQQADWPAEPITLTVQSVPVNGKTIHEILKERHIFQDVEAFSIVYALNPQIKKLRDLNVQEIRIPIVEGGAKLKALWGSGFTVYLTLDKELKEQFSANVEQLTGLTKTISDFAAEKFGGQAAKEATVASMQHILDALTRINDRLVQRFGRPVPTEALRQLGTELALLNRMLSGKAAPEARISKEEQGQIAAVEKDVAVKKRAYVEVAAGGAPDRWPEVTVMVKTLKDSGEVPRLRIYYVPVALRGQESEVKSFGKLSSPSNQSLPEADYCFWATKDTDKNAVTNEQCLEIRIDRQAEVQLTVIR